MNERLYMKKEENEKGREWKKEINHELLIPQFNYAMIKGENLINQFKEDSMKTGGEYKMSDINYISSILITSLIYSWKHAHFTWYFS